MDAPVILPGDWVMVQIPAAVDDRWDEFIKILKVELADVTWSFIVGGTKEPRILFIYRDTTAS
jgi:hypothetical protein